MRDAESKPLLMAKTTVHHEEKDSDESRKTNGVVTATKDSFA